MNKEMFKKYIEECGGIEDFIKCREELMELVCAIDDVVEIDARIDFVEVPAEEINGKVVKMLSLMSELLA